MRCKCSTATFLLSILHLADHIDNNLSKRIAQSYEVLLIYRNSYAGDIPCSPAADQKRKNVVWIMLHIFINIFVVSLSSYQLWRRKTFMVKSCLSKLLSKLSFTSLSAMTTVINQKIFLIFFRIPWWESLLEASCLYLCSIQALVRLRELQIWRLFIIISYWKVFHGQLHQDKCIVCTCTFWSIIPVLF